MTPPKNGPIWSNISGSTGPIFANFTPYERALCVDDGWLCSFFSNLLRDVAMATDFMQKKMENSPFSSLWHSETVWDIAMSMGALTAELMPVYCVKILQKLVQ